MDIPLLIKNLHKYYGKHEALKGIDISIKKGEIYGFVGPNGAGKTTTIKCSAGVINFDEGTILINGIDIKKKPVLAKRFLSYVPDTPFLYDKLTGREFLFFVGKLYGMDDKEINRSITYYSELLKFADYMDLKTSDYSHGMKQRIVIASAFIHNPQIVLIDEPMVGLDPGIAKVVKELFVNYSKKNNSAILVSTHTLSLVEDICDTIGVINHGRIVYTGDLANIKKELEDIEELYLEITGGSSIKE